MLLMRDFRDSLSSSNGYIALKHYMETSGKRVLFQFELVHEFYQTSQMLMLGKILNLEKNLLMASSKYKAPMLLTLVVGILKSQLEPTKLCAARLYTSSNWLSRIISNTWNWSLMSKLIKVTFSSIFKTFRRYSSSCEFLLIPPKLRNFSLKEGLRDKLHLGRLYL